MIFDKLITNPSNVLKIVIDSIEKNNPLLLTYFNQHCFNIYYQNNEYKKLLDERFSIFQADLGIYLALKFFGKKFVSRIDSTELNQLILEELIRRKIPITIVGGNFEKDSLFTNAQNRGIKLERYLDGYFENSETEKYIREINEVNSQVILIGMGVPKQEFFAERLSKSISNSIIICVGNFFEFYFGTKKRAPIFIQKIGLEWSYRLLTEPSRLWKRYIFGIPLFTYRILKFKFNRKIPKSI